MVHKAFCDICGAELPHHYEESAYHTGHFVQRGKGLDLCRFCADKVRHQIEELKETYTLMGILKGKLADLKGQKELTDFE